MLSYLIPSMFLRRLTLLSALVIAGAALPAVQLVRLTVVKGDQLREEAEK